MLCPHSATAQYGSGWSFSSRVVAEGQPGAAAPTITKPIIISADGSGSGTATLQGQVKVTANWTPPPYPPNATPPATVTIRFNSAVQAWGSYGTRYGTQNVTLSTPQCDNGVGDPTVLLTNSIYTSPQGGSNWGSKEWSCSGLHLKTFSTSGGSWDYTNGKKWKVELPETTISATLSATASGFSSAGATDANVNVRLLGFNSIESDSRDVELTGVTNGMLVSGTNAPGISCYATSNNSSIPVAVSKLALKINGEEIALFPKAGETGTLGNNVSRSIAAWDSTHFQSGTVPVKVLATFSDDATAEKTINVKVLNSAYILQNNTFGVKSSAAPAAAVQSSNYKVKWNNSDTNALIISSLPDHNVFYTDTHGSPTGFGDTQYDRNGHGGSISATDVQTAIASKTTVLPPYNIVMFDACNTLGFPTNMDSGALYR